MKTLLIVFHSRTGGAAQMAHAAHQGASGEPGIKARLGAAANVGPDDLLAAQAFLFAMPENLAAMSGPMKDFFDRCYYPALDRLNGRPYALLVCAGSDGQGAMRQATRIATGWRLRAVAAPVIVRTHAQTEATILAPKTIAPADLTRCHDLGASVATGLAMGIF